MTEQPEHEAEEQEVADPVILAPRRTATSGWGIFFGMPFVWAIPYLMFSGLVVLIMPLYLGFIFAPLMAFMIIYACHRAVNEARHRNGRIIVGYLDTAVRLNLPLIPFLNAATRSERGRCAAQLNHLCNALHAGIPVGAALAELPDVSEETVGRISAGEAMGQLRQGVARTMELDRQVDDERTENPDGPLFRLYPFFMLLASVTVVTGVLIFVVPKFKEIFKDFKTALPHSTQILMSFASAFSEDSPMGLLVILALAALLLLFVSTFLTNIFAPSLQLPAFSPIARWFAWRLPITRSLERSRGMAETCDLLNSSISDGASLPATLQRAELLPLNPGFRLEIMTFREHLLKGKSPAQAASLASLPPLLVGLLATPTDSTESQSAMFGFLARHYRQRFSRAILVIRSSFEPLFVLLFGSIVGFILFALFSPLVKLISSVAGYDNGGVL